MYTTITTTKTANQATKKSLGFLLVLFFTFAYFVLFAPSALAAVSHSTSSESHTGTSGNASSTSFSWTHGDTGSPEGVLVFVTTIANADYITSVTYGGVTMTQVSEAIDTTTEPARVTAFFLGSSVPTGSQTIEVTRTNNATVMYANAASVQAAGNTETTGYVLLQNNLAYSEQSVDDGSLGTNSMRYVGAYTGRNTALTAGANTTALQSIVLAATQASMLGRETTAGQGARSVGYTYATTDDAAAIHLAIRETPSPYFAGTLYTDAGVTTAGSGKTIKMWVGTSTPSIFSTTTNSSGAWEFSNADVSSATSGTPFVIWLDGDANDATTFVSGYSTGIGVRNIPLYYEHVIAYGASSTVQINPLNFTYDTVSDADILHFLNGEEFVSNGDFLISRGEFVSAPSIQASGDFINRGIFNANGGVVYMTGSGVVDGILTATSSFSTLDFDNSSSYSIATTSASTSNLYISAGSSLVAPTNLTVGSFHNGGTFDNNGGQIYTDTALVGFSGAVDMDGSATGTDAVTINKSITYGNYLFIGTAGEATPCSQTPGSAIGCEIQVYDVSDPTNMIYVAGRDVDGSADGNFAEFISSFTIKDNILFVGKGGVNTACTQSGTNAQGCELMSFDITDPTNPVFLTSIDHDGALNGNSQLFFLSLAASGNYLYAGKELNSASCGQTSGAGDGCELMVFDISSSTNMVYVAGRDSTGSSTGSGVNSVYSLVVNGDYLYASTGGDTAACSPTPGSAAGCELQVYDISSSTNPIYRAGRDAEGDAGGSSGNVFLSMAKSGNYLYIANAGGSSACSQVAGAAYNCELQVYDISSSTNPIYRAGRDVGGSVGTFTGLVYSVVIKNEHLFLGKEDNATTCSQIPDSAVGCELQVYNLASSTNPIYVAGRDSNGSPTGATGVVAMGALSVGGNYLYLGKEGSLTACSSVTGSAIGCEIMSFQLSPEFSGDLVGANALNHLTVGGSGLLLGTSTEVNNLTITQGTVEAPAELIVNGNYVNSGTFDANNGTVFLTSLGGVASGTMTGTSAFANLEVSGVGTETFTTAYASGQVWFRVFAIDETNDVLYAGSGDNGILYRCILTTNCDASGDFAVAYDTTHQIVYSIVVDEVNGALYVGVGSPASGALYRCVLSSDCNASGDFSEVYDADGNGFYALGIDTQNNVLYGGDYNVFYRCPLSSDCNAQGDFSSFAISGYSGDVVIDEVNDVMYVTVGYGGAGAIYRCVLSSSCDANGDFSFVINNAGIDYLTPIEIDTTNQVLYAGGGGSSDIIYRCPLSSDCNASGDFTTITGLDTDVGDTLGGITALQFDSGHGFLYAGGFGSGQILFRCETSTACDSAADWALVQTISDTTFTGAMTIDTSRGTLYVGDDDAVLRRGGGVTLTATASTTSFTVAAGKSVTAPSSALSVTNGDFTNNGAFDANGGEVILLGAVHALNGTTTFFDLTKNATVTATTTFGAGTLTTIEGEWNFTGTSSSERHLLRSSTNGQYWYVNPATTTLANIDVKDSNNVNVSTVVCDIGCLDSGNNVNWPFTPAEAIEFYSAAPYHFYVGQATTTLGAVVIAESVSPSITTANDIRISIATTTSNFRFNTGTTNLTFGGTAAGKVSTTASYEEAGATLVLTVTENFAASDTLIVNGITAGSFAAVSTTTSAFELHTDGNTAGEPAALDTQTIRITGSVTIANHAAGQVENEFSAQNKDDVPLFAFNLVGQSEVITVTDLVVSLSGVQGLDSSNLSDFNLYRDNDSDGVLDGGDLLLDGDGILTFNGQHGAVTFSQNFVASTSVNYLVTADTTGTQLGDSVVFSLPALGLTALGATSVYAPVILTTVNTSQHFRNSSGGGGGNVARIGDPAPAGAGVVEGGETGGGVGAGEEEDGENIAADPDFARPNATGDSHNEWTNGENALLSDGTYATAASTNLRQSYNGFNFNVPDGNTIQGIAVKLDASGSTAAGTIDVSLSWDSGNSYTTAKATPTMAGSDVVYLVGGASDLWGRSWTAAQFSGANFRLRVSAQPASNTIRLDALEVRVYHQAGGGSSGGGGGI